MHPSSNRPRCSRDREGYVMASQYQRAKRYATFKFFASGMIIFAFLICLSGLAGGIAP